MAHEHHQDPTFYRSPGEAAAAPPEKLACVATFSRPAAPPDALAVVDVDPDSASYAQVVGFTERVYFTQVRLQGGDASSDSYCYPS